MISCPHCNAHRIFTAKVPKDMIVVLPCPACHELVVLFQNRVLAVSRRIIEHGTFEERKMHFAHLIAEFFEQGSPFGDFSMRPDKVAPDDSEGIEDTLFSAHETMRQAMHQTFFQGAGVPAQPVTPITQEEIDQFIRVDLRRIDEADYFKKNLN